LVLLNTDRRGFKVDTYRHIRVHFFYYYEKIMNIYSEYILRLNRVFTETIKSFHPRPQAGEDEKRKKSQMPCEKSASRFRGKKRRIS